MYQYQDTDTGLVHTRVSGYSLSRSYLGGLHVAHHWISSTLGFFSPCPVFCFSYHVFLYQYCQVSWNIDRFIGLK